MGAIVSVLLPNALVGCVGFLVAGKIGIAAACAVPLVFEAAHGVTDSLIGCEGKLQLDEQAKGARDWDLMELGVRSFSLNFCGRWNHFFDFIRRCLAPIASSLSGRMIHDVVMAKVKNPEDGCEALLVMCKCHNGDIEVSFCADLVEADKFGRPVVFCPPDRGWWSEIAGSYGVKVRDLIEELQCIPASYRPVTNNCHHFAKEVWNWHAKLLVEKMESTEIAENLQGPPVIDGIKKKTTLKQIRWPRGRCRRYMTEERQNLIAAV